MIAGHYFWGEGVVVAKVVRCQIMQGGQQWNGAGRNGPMGVRLGRGDEIHGWVGL